MKLPDFYKFTPFYELRKKMNAPLGNFNVSIIHTRKASRDERYKLQGKGIAIKTLDDIYELKDGTIAYKDRRILLYIRDMGKFLSRFHVAWCKTLEEMKKEKRFSRYVISNRTDGIFEIRRMHDSYYNSDNNGYKTTNEELPVCKYCLGHINFNNYSNNNYYGENKKIFDSFTLENFFSQYPISPLNSKPKAHYTSDTAPTDTYPLNFSDISAEYKLKQDYCCEGCGIDLSERGGRRFLHTHHINGRKDNCTEGNLRSLCVKCHSEQYKHDYMQETPQYKEFEIL